MLAKYADGGRIQAASLVAFGMVAPLAFPLAAGAAALATLRHGVAGGLIVAALGVIPVVGLVVAFGGNSAGFVPILLMLAATIALAEVLRAAGSLSLALQVGVVVAVVGLLIFLAVLGDAANFWRELFAETLDRMVAQGAGLTTIQRDAWMNALPFEALTGVVAGLATLMVWVGLFIGRSWQAQRVNPGGFGRDFRALSLGKTLALASAVLFFASAVVRQDWLLNMAAMLIHLWIIQGLSYLHWTVGDGDRRSMWLLVSYGLLGLFWMTGNPLAILVPFVGMAGEIVGYRRRVTQWRGNRKP